MPLVDEIDVIDGSVAPTRRTVKTLGTITRGIGDDTDTAVTAGASGSLSAKIRLLTTQINSLLGYTDGIEGYVDSLEGYTDGIEASVDDLEGSLGLSTDATISPGATGTLQSKLRLLTTLVNNAAISVDGMYVSAIGAPSDLVATAGSAGSVNSKLRLLTSQLNTQAGYLDQVEGYIDQIEGYIDGIEGLLTTISTSAGYTSTPTITRAANTTPYTAGDVVGGAITFTNVGPTAGNIFLNSLSIVLNIASIPTGMTTFRLHLYSATPPSAIADNAAFTFAGSDRALYLGYIDIPAVELIGASVYAWRDGIAKEVKLAASSTSLFGYLVTNAGYTPAANSETYDTRLGATAL